MSLGQRVKVTLKADQLVGGVKIELVKIE
ncbi:hypothetical protein B4U80_06275 [Leptotrombidium deliense]|uniref:Uncharacterized protein n=1 Tax=Leptotrombidium deliense TaxID=299467 RepID=A0A443RY68_9ACAR|nr:hypothetical protein B4U80_06275 [Leptotrombidium deliense]